MKTPSNNFFYKNNRLQQLRGFCAAMQFGNLTKAATYMGLSHTAISLQIKTLEEDLNVQLFRREGVKNVPTKDAEILYKVAIVHVEGINDIYNAFIAEKENASDEITIGANNAAITNILPQLLKGYLDEQPNMHLHIRFAEQEDGLDMLKQDKIDVLLLPRREGKAVDPEYYVYRPLFHYAPVLLTLPDHPLAGKPKLTMEEICEYEVTMPPRETTLVANLYETIERHRQGRRFKLTFEDWWVMRKYIEAGLAISISADMSHEGPDDKLCKTSLLHLFPAIDFGFITKKHRKPDKNLKAFFKVAEQCGAQMSSDLL